MSIIIDPCWGYKINIDDDTGEMIDDNSDEAYESMRDDELIRRIGDE